MNQKKLELVILSTFLISLVLLALTLAYLDERKNRIDKMLITSSSGSENVAGGPQSNQEKTNKGDNLGGNSTFGETVKRKTGKPNDNTSAILPKYQDRKLNVNNLLKSANFFLNATLNLLNEIIPRSLIKHKFPITTNNPNNLLNNKQEIIKQKPLLPITYPLNSGTTTPQQDAPVIPIINKNNTANQIQPTDSIKMDSDLIENTKQIIMNKLKNGQELFLNTTYNLENGLQFQFEKRKNFIKNHNSYILVIFKNENYTNSTRFLLSGVQIQEETRTSYYGTQHSTSIQIKSIESINKDPIKTRTGTRKN